MTPSQTKHGFFLSKKEKKQQRSITPAGQHISLRAPPAKPDKTTTKTRERCTFRNAPTAYILITGNAWKSPRTTEACPGTGNARSDQSRDHPLRSGKNGDPHRRIMSHENDRRMVVVSRGYRLSSEARVAFFLHVHDCANFAGGTDSQRRRALRLSPRFGRVCDDYDMPEKPASTLKKCRD